MDFFGSEIKFVEEEKKIKERYCCVVCKKLLREPCQIIPCGHIHCKSCIDMLPSLCCPALECGKNFSREQMFPDKAIEKEMKHLEVYCPNKTRGCVLPIKWKDLKSHLETCKADNLKSCVQCPFKENGCKQLIKRESFDEHVKNCKFKHKPSKGSRQTQFTPSAEGQFERYPSDVDSGYYANQEDRNKEQMEVHIKEYLAKIEELENTSYDGCAIYKVENYYDRKEQATRHSGKCTDSHPFYTHRYGYKMCIRLSLNWDKHGISISPVLMKGGYDNLLKWPFTHPISLTLIDQKDVRKSLTKTFQPGPTTTNLHKPDNHKNEVKDYNFFIPYTDLEADTATYLKEDTIFIKAKVHTDGIAVQ